METLPDEITTNILSRSPFKSLGQCRCVSKLWCSILADPTLPSTQLTHLSKIRPDIFLFYEKRKGPKTFYIEENENVFNQTPIKPFKTFDSKFLTKAFYRLPYVLGACNGFICLSEIDVFNMSLLPRNPIFVFNPITGERAELPHFRLPDREVPYWIDEGKKTDKCFSGLGFDEISKKHKLVLVVFGARDYAKQIFNNDVQIYTFGSKKWRRKKGVVPDVLSKVPTKVSDAFVKGSLHWIAVDQDSENKGPLIVSFDVGVERFEFVPTPEKSLLKYPHYDYELGVLEDDLVLVECSRKGCVEIWVMEKYTIEESWVKKFSIERYLVSLYGLCKTVDIVKICSNGDLLLLCDSEYLVSYNAVSGECRFLKIKGIKERERTVDKEAPNRLLAIPFVGTCLSLKSVYGMDSDTRNIPMGRERSEVPDCRLS